MNLPILRNLFILLFVALFNACAVAQTGASLSDKTVEKWFNSKEWAGGLKLNVYNEVNKREFYIQYHKNKAWWDQTFAYLRDHDLQKLPVGKTLIVGDSVTLSVTEAPDKEFDKTAWESHGKFIDLQYIVSGKERMVVSDISKLTVTEPYSEAKDVARYSGDGRSYIAEPGTYYLFFPSDAHRPSIKVDGYDLVKKVVFKIRYSK